LVALKAAIPFVAPSAAALLIVTVDPTPDEFAIVNAPVKLSRDVTPPLTEQVGQERVKVPPRATAPPPLKGPVVLTVIDEFARFALVIPALPDKLEFVSPAIVVGVTEVTRPWASVVSTGILSADPYVPAVPVFGKDRVVVPPSDTEPPPDRPVPAVTVKDELARAAFAIEPAGRVIDPDVTVSPFDAVRSPADVIVPVPVVNIFPVVEIVIFAARSDPETEENVGSPAAFPCNTVVVVPARVPNNPAAVLVTTPFVVRPESVSDVVPVTVVNLPVEAVVAPIAVLFIPVAVVLKFPEVKVRLLAPVLIEEAPSPDKVKAPDVPVRFKAPVVRVKPFEAVTSPEKVGLAIVAKVTVPVPLFVVVMLVPAANVNVPPRVIAEFEPLVAAAVNRVPALDKQVGQDKVNVPPSASAPPPLSGPVVLTVTEEFVRAAFAIEPAGKLTDPAETVRPFEAVRSPAEVIVPVPDVEIFPEVVTASPAVAGDNVVPVLFQKPRFPVEGAVVVRTLEPSV
jgi:hypothetical protein